jgi:hypothetical protein
MSPHPGLASTVVAVAVGGFEPLCRATTSALAKASSESPTNSARARHGVIGDVVVA